MRSILTFPVVLIACYVAQTAAMRAEACVPDQGGVPVCGEGKGAMRVFADTISPSKQYAFAWRSPDGLPSGDATPSDDVDNILIRLSDGAAVAKLGGRYWATGVMRANRYDLVAAWSPDSKAVIELANSRWDSDVFTYYLLDADAVAKLDLLALVKPALKAKLPAKDRSNYAFRVAEEKPVALDVGGHLGFTATLYRPKSDEASFDYKVRVGIISKKGRPTARIVSVQRVKSD